MVQRDGSSEAATAATTTPAQRKALPTAPGAHSGSGAGSSAVPGATASLRAPALASDGRVTAVVGAVAAATAAAAVVAAASPLGQKRPRATAAAAAAAVNRQPEQLQQQPHLSMQRAQAQGGEPQWDGEPQAPPAPLRPTPHRHYYAAFIKASKHCWCFFCCCLESYNDTN
jgi:hypothetical protein